MTAGPLPAGGTMSRSEYRIRRALLVVWGLDTLLLFCLMMIALLTRGAATERLIFTLFFLPAFVFFLECLYRRVAVAEEGLVIRKWGRTKAFPWSDITRVDCLTVRRKVYLLLTTLGGLFVVSNAFEGFTRLVEQIASRVPAERIEKDVLPQAAAAGTGSAVLIPAWIAAVLVTAMIAMKLLTQAGF